jgi:hypothetical protein
VKFLSEEPFPEAWLYQRPSKLAMSLYERPSVRRGEMEKKRVAFGELFWLHSLNLLFFLSTLYLFYDSISAWQAGRDLIYGRAAIGAKAWR